METESLVLLPSEEQSLRLSNLRRLMGESGISAALLGGNANLYYLTGRVYSGFIYLPVSGQEVYFVKDRKSVV